MATICFALFLLRLIGAGSLALAVSARALVLVICDLWAVVCGWKNAANR
jgi:hypothetical protein